MSFGFEGGVTNELLHTDRGDETFRFLSRFNRLHLAGFTKMKRSMMPHEVIARYGIKWSSPEEIVLFNGTEIAANINDCMFPAMPQGNCFANAFRLALSDPSLRYHEGWACMEGSVPTHHGWVVDAFGRVQDPTWLTVVRNPTQGIPPHNINRCIYMGVHIPLAQHIGWFLSEGDVNLLARGEMIPAGLLERGMELFTDHDGAEPDDAIRRAILEVLNQTAQWVLDEATGVFSRSDTGQRWCGHTQRFLNDGE